MGLHLILNTMILPLSDTTKISYFQIRQINQTLHQHMISTLKFEIFKKKLDEKQTNF